MGKTLTALWEITLYSAIVTSAILLFQWAFRKQLSAGLRYLCWVLRAE